MNARAAKIGAEIAVPIAILAAWQAWTVQARISRSMRLPAGSGRP